MIFTFVLESLAGTSLPPHLFFIVQLMALAFAYTLIVSFLGFLLHPLRR